MSIKKNKGFFPLVEAEGTNYEIGYIIGKKFRDRIIKTFKDSRIIKNLVALADSNPDRINHIELLVKNQFPQYIKEIEGMADGVDLDYQKLVSINFRAVPEEDDRKGNCSTMIYKNESDIILGHNEDFDDIIGINSYIVKVKLDSTLTFISHAYPGILPGTSFGFNSHGIAHTVNTLTPPINRIGIPRHFLARSLLETKSLDEAISKAFNSPPISGGASYNIASMHEKRVINLETTSEDSSLTEITDQYFHTNHYISEKFQNIPIAKFSTSPGRFKRGMQLLPSANRTVLGVVNSLKDKYIFVKALKDHNGAITMTLCTAVFTLSNSVYLDVYPREDHYSEVQSFSFADLKFEN